MSNLIIINNCHTHCFVYYFETLQTTASITKGCGDWHLGLSGVATADLSASCYTTCHLLLVLSKKFLRTSPLLGESTKTYSHFAVWGLLLPLAMAQTPDRKDQQPVVSVPKDTQRRVKLSKFNTVVEPIPNHRPVALGFKSQPLRRTVQNSDHWHGPPVQHWPLDHCAPYV